MGLWTYDVNLDRVPEPSPTADLAADLALEELMWGAYVNEWEENPDLTHTWGITEAFQSHFASGFQVSVTVRCFGYQSSALPGTVQRLADM